MRCCQGMWNANLHSQLRGFLQDRVLGWLWQQPATGFLAEAPAQLPWIPSLGTPHCCLVPTHTWGHINPGGPPPSLGRVTFITRIFKHAFITYLMRFNSHCRDLKEQPLHAAGKKSCLRAALPLSLLANSQVSFLNPK